MKKIMTSCSGKKSVPVKVENEVPVLLEDQQKINKFARQNARIDEIIEEIKLQKKTLEDLEEAEGEALLSVEEDSTIPYKLGEIFIDLDAVNFQKTLTERKEKIEKEIEELESQKDEVKRIMIELKVDLYSKFGDSINLEPEEN